MSVFAPQVLGVFEAGAGDPRTVPMALTGAALLAAGCCVAVSAADVQVWTLARLARCTFARE